MKYKNKIKVIIVCYILFLSSCSIMDVDYLDDNYSDRVDLAIKLLGNESVYFDTSTYETIEDQAIPASPHYITSNNKFSGGGVYDLVRQLKLIGLSHGKIAVSGNLANETTRVLIAALAELKDGTLQGTTILYIGDNKYKAEIQRKINEKGAEFIFAKTPKTTL